MSSERSGCLGCSNVRVNRDAMSPFPGVHMTESFHRHWPIALLDGRLGGSSSDFELLPQCSF